MINVIKYGYPLQKIPDIKGRVIFLAGPTVRGHQQHLLPSWRDAAIHFIKDEYLKIKDSTDSVKQPLTIIIPEFENKSESDKGRYDLPIWEFAGLQRADLILFWVNRSRELIGLTTNFELGYWLAKNPNKVFYGRPDDSYRTDYNDVMYKHLLEDQFYNDLESICRFSTNRVLHEYKY
jgi:hypothetical protein